MADDCTAANEEVSEEVRVKGVEEDMEDVEEVRDEFVEEAVQRGRRTWRS